MNMYPTTKNKSTKNSQQSIRDFTSSSSKSNKRLVSSSSPTDEQQKKKPKQQLPLSTAEKITDKMDNEHIVNGEPIANDKGNHTGVNAIGTTNTVNLEGALSPLVQEIKLLCESVDEKYSSLDDKYTRLENAITLQKK